MGRRPHSRQNHPQNGGPCGLGAAVRDSDGSLIVVKRGQNVGYQGYLILLPTEGQGLVVMTNSDNGSFWPKP